MSKRKRKYSQFCSDKILSVRAHEFNNESMKNTPIFIIREFLYTFQPHEQLINKTVHKIAFLKRHERGLISSVNKAHVLLVFFTVLITY